MYELVRAILPCASLQERVRFRELELSSTQNLGVPCGLRVTLTIVHLEATTRLRA